MSIHPAQDPRLTFDFADRLRKALRMSNVSVQDMADSLEVSRNAVSNWINGRNMPRSRDLARFALKTGFPREWLETGRVSPNTGPEADNFPNERIGNLQPTSIAPITPLRRAA